jgi:hypothetical protein
MDMLWCLLASASVRDCDDYFHGTDSGNGGQRSGPFNCRDRTAGPRRLGAPVIGRVMSKKGLYNLNAQLNPRSRSYLALPHGRRDSAASSSTEGIVET